MRSPVGRNALIYCCKRYGVLNIESIDRATVRHWYESKIVEELMSRPYVIILLELIFIRDGSYKVTASKAPQYSRSEEFRLYL